MIARRRLFIGIAFALAGLAGARGPGSFIEEAGARRRRKRRRRKHY